MPFDFYLGTHRPDWMPQTDVPLFVSAATLWRRRTFPKAKGRWAFDSGGFSQLRLHGRWIVDDPQLVDLVRRTGDAAGYPDFAAPRDWMCEPFMLERTGLTVLDHQRRTIDSYTALRELAPEIAWLPVLQGWHADEYEHCAELYRTHGSVELRDQARVGVGSVCRRQATRDGAAIMNRVADLGIRAHAFGIKTEGLRLFGHRIASADSMAWSFIARRRGMLLESCTRRTGGATHRNCANCLPWALEWHRTRILKLPATTREICTRARGEKTNEPRR